MSPAKNGLEAFREWQRREQAERHAFHYGDNIPLGAAAQLELDEDLAELGIRPIVRRGGVQ